jgi:hypothetical protein
MRRPSRLLFCALFTASACESEPDEPDIEAEATMWCNEEQGSGSCTTDATIDECIDCYVGCGKACRPLASCPPQFDGCD